MASSGLSKSVVASDAATVVIVVVGQAVGVCKDSEGGLAEELTEFAGERILQFRDVIVAERKRSTKLVDERINILFELTSFG